MQTLGNYELFIIAFGAIGFGLYLLIKGGDWTISAASYIAEKAGLSKLFIGATIVAFGTSIPELFTSVNANLSGFVGLSIGNIVGSNIANILLILGATAVIFAIKANPREIMKDTVMMVLASCALVGLMLTGIIERWQGAAMFLLLVAYVAYQYRTDSGTGLDDDDDEEDGPQIESMQQAGLFVLAGLTVLVIGSEMLVQGAVSLGNAVGVPEAVIGLTVVALGTSLPELATCIAAARRQETNMILGNILGSNYFNILSIIGLTAMMKPLVVDPAVSDMDMWVMLGVTTVFAVWILTVAKIGRVLGAAMVVAYLAFTIHQYGAVVGV